MAKGRKRTKGLAMTAPTPSNPEEMMGYSARSLMRDAQEASPTFKAGVRQLTQLAKRLVRRGKAAKQAAKTD